MEFDHVDMATKKVNLTAESDSFVSKEISSVDVVANVKDDVWEQGDGMGSCKACSSNKHDKHDKTWDLLEVNLTAESDSFVSKKIPSVDGVANSKDDVWKQEDGMGLCKEVNLTAESDSFVSKEIPSVDVVTNVKDDVWKQEDEMGLCKEVDLTVRSNLFGSYDQLKSTHVDDQMQSTHDDDKMQSSHSDDQIQSTHGDDQIKSTHGDDHMQSSHGDEQIKSTHGMICTNLVLLLRALYNLPSASTLGTILVLGLLLNPFCSLSNATNLDRDCLRTFVSGFVYNGEDLVFHCKCKCSCSHSWRWSGGPNNVDLTNNQQVLSSNIEKINITENPPGVHDYSMTLKTKETDFFSSDFTCHNGFATKKIDRFELLQHVSLQSTVTSTMSSPEQTKSSIMLTHQQTRTTTMSTLKPTMTSYNSKMSGGKIAGIVIGSVLGALVVGVAVFLVRRECNPPKKEETEEEMQMNSTP